jgi:hypothetical protein
MSFLGTFRLNYATVDVRPDRFRSSMTHGLLVYIFFQLRSVVIAGSL